MFKKGGLISIFKEVDTPLHTKTQGQLSDRVRALRWSGEHILPYKGHPVGGYMVLRSSQFVRLTVKV